MKLRIVSYEFVPAGSDINALGQCQEMTFAPQSMGEAVIATDPVIGALQVPFRLR